MRDYYTIKINLPGGIVSPGYLKDILTAAWESGLRKVRFGARQQLLMTVHYEVVRFLEKDLQKRGVGYELNSETYPNIISSYCGEEVFRTGQWLGANEYHSVLDSFDYQPLLKVNISDSNQSFTPFFTGNLNFVSSPEPHFWYLYIRSKQSNNLFRWPELIYTNEIGRLAKITEDCMLNEGCQNLETLYDAVKKQTDYISVPATQELELPAFTLPYYEGFNRYESRTWLGLYRRDELFSVEFLIDLCLLCLKTRVGEICATPWKSLIIKGIEDIHRNAWSSILGKHNINVRHAANELAWQTEDHNEDGTILKDYLVRYVEKNDTRTFGLCFGIQTRAKSEVFGSVLIRKRPLFQIAQLSLFSVYDLYFTENFNPNSRKHILFQKGLFKIHLPWQLERLCRQYNTRKTSENTEAFFLEKDEVKSTSPATLTAHQCPNCMTIYHPEYGDILNNIPPKTSFEALPQTYCCPTCGTEKNELTEIQFPAAVLI
ncbi:rubredoxin domain-containing protein [Dyadobacter sp. LHD-138]|uniref:rubredoxin domain-containing protein n=1 Tax=Dyadobacter sp. LHD-138 TaxID=3071413 RepID=UPI0027E0D1AA|nr:rubredoxin domain-containing protein [Dyadobacter sp. LHD-138]MDQ6478382.1 rubredoxin domain-containing protein [Dyadobacter sp. LHD-138]